MLHDSYSPPPEITTSSIRNATVLGDTVLTNRTCCHWRRGSSTVFCAHVVPGAVYSATVTHVVSPSARACTSIFAPLFALDDESQKLTLLAAPTIGLIAASSFAFSDTP